MTRLELLIFVNCATQKGRCPLLFPGDLLMSVRHWQAVLLTLAVLSGLGGCSGNYKFNDAAYRPLGDPQAINRGK
jgi:hypothetical protein